MKKYIFVRPETLAFSTAGQDYTLTQGQTVELPDTRYVRTMLAHGWITPAPEPVKNAKETAEK